MINICNRCGLYRADKTIDLSGPFAVCPECGHAYPFVRLPLFVVGGASGTGKTTVCASLLRNVQDAVLLDSDILWRPEFNKPEDQYREFFETWLRMSKNIGQSGRPVMIFGAGFAVPDNLEPCIERRYFSTVHYLALVCSPEALVARLEERPSWRNSNDQAFVTAQLTFNQWLQDYRPAEGEPDISLLDTTAATVDEIQSGVLDWFSARHT